MSNELTKKESTALAVPEELVERLAAAQENLVSVEMSTLPKVRMTSDGVVLTDGEVPLTELEVIVLHTRKTNTYYKNTYNKNKIEPPTCFSLDGVKPELGVKEKQNETCRGCPKAQFGTSAMGSGKACRNLKPLYVLLSAQSVMPRVLTITPTSIKAANNYLLDITDRGIGYRDVRTKIVLTKKDPDDKFMVASFKMGEKLTAEEKARVEYLRQFWLPIMNNEANIGDEQNAS